MSIYVWLIPCVWLLCGFATVGFAYAYFAHCDESFRLWSAAQLAEQKRDSLAFAVCWGLLGGPVSLCASFFLTGFWQHGWRLR